MKLRGTNAQIFAHKNRSLGIVVITRRGLVSQRGIKALRRNHFVRGIQIKPLIATFTRELLQRSVKCGGNAAPTTGSPNIKTFYLSTVRDSCERAKGYASHDMALSCCDPYTSAAAEVSAREILFCIARDDAGGFVIFFDDFPRDIQIIGWSPAYHERVG